MIKKIIILGIILVVVLAGSLGYLYLTNRQGSQVLDTQDVTTCQTDAECGWYQSANDSGSTVICGNLNIIKNHDRASAGNPPANSICVCTNNACQSATFTLPTSSEL